MLNYIVGDLVRNNRVVFIGGMVQHKLSQVLGSCLDFSFCSVQKEGEVGVELLLVILREVIDFHVSLDQRQHPHIPNVLLPFQNLMNV